MLSMHNATTSTLICYYSSRSLMAFDHQFSCLNASHFIRIGGRVLCKVWYRGFLSAVRADCPFCTGAATRSMCVLSLLSLPVSCAVVYVEARG